MYSHSADHVASQLPFYEKQINISLLRRMSIQVLLWSKDDKSIGSMTMIPILKQDLITTQSNLGLEDGERLEVVKTNLAGETHFAINRFIHEEMVLREEHQNKFIQIPMWSKQETRLWLHGMVVGSISCEFLIKAQPFLMQLLCGIRCETGIAKSITTVKTANKTSDNRVKIQLDDLRNIEETLPEKMIELEKGSRSAWQVQSQIYSDLARARDILKSSDKISSTCFHYHEIESITKAQNIFIGFGEALLKHWKMIPESSYGLFLECLDLLLNRGELDLSYIGFVAEIEPEKRPDYAFDSQIYSASSEKIIDKKSLAHSTSIHQESKSPKDPHKKTEEKLKLKVGVRYNEFMKKCLKNALLKMELQDLLENEKKFLEMFLAQAFFRIPAFRRKCRRSILNDQKIIIDEWRGTEWSLNTDDFPAKSLKHFTALFDWPNDFYNYILPSMSKHYEEYEPILSVSEFYVQKLSKRTGYFFFFLCEWCKYVKRTLVVVENIPWQLIPDYKFILKVFIHEFKEKQGPISIPMRSASKALLINSALINLFFTILYKKTNLFNSQGVFDAYELINHWFLKLKSNGSTLPSTFEGFFFMKGIFTVLESDHSLCIAKVIWFIYNNFDMFSDEMRYEICDHFMTDTFVKLFLNWNFHVRQTFYHFLLFRILPFFWLSEQSIEAKDDLSEIETIQKLLLTDIPQSTRLKLSVNPFFVPFVNVELAFFQKDAESEAGVLEVHEHHPADLLGKIREGKEENEAGLAIEGKTEIQKTKESNQEKKEQE